MRNYTLAPDIGSKGIGRAPLKLILVKSKQRNLRKVLTRLNRKSELDKPALVKL